MIFAHYLISAIKVTLERLIFGKQTKNCLGDHECSENVMNSRGGKLSRSRVNIQGRIQDFSWGGAETDKWGVLAPKTPI